MSSAVFVKTIENVEILTNYHATKFFTENLLAKEMKNKYSSEYICLFRTFSTRIKWNINVWILVRLRKTKIWCTNYIVLYGYSYTGGFIVHIKTDDIYEDIVEDIETIFRTSN